MTPFFRTLVFPLLMMPELAFSQATEAPEPTSTTIIATVDETPLTLGEVIALRQALPQEYQDLPDEVLMETLLQELSDQQLLANAAIAGGLLQRTNVQLALKNFRRKVLAEAFLADALAKRVDEAAIEAAYKEKYTDQPPVLEVRAAHILLQNEDLARELKKRLADGADFAALAAEHGTDSTAPLGGDLGWFAREMVLPAFAEAVFAMEPGSIADPVQTALGWHLIRLDAVRDRPVPPIEMVREAIRKELQTEARRALLDEARATGQIVRPEVGVPDAAVRLDNLIER